MIWHPPSILPYGFVLKVVLCSAILITGDDVSIRVDEACLPVVAADNIGDVIPGVTFRGL
jgi:hypothetical protein